MKISYTLVILLSCLTHYTALHTHPNFDNIIQEHITLLSNLDKVNPPLMILFSATPGMGKTTLATNIQNVFDAVKITVDDARKLLVKHAIPVRGDSTYKSLPIEEKIECIVNYLDQLIQEIRKTSKNQFFIIDDSVNQWHDKIQRIADKNGMQTFLIRLDVSKAKAIERIKQREQDPQGYLDAMDTWYYFYQQFDAHLVDYVFCNENIFDIKEFDELLDQLKIKLPS